MQQASLAGLITALRHELGDDAVDVDPTVHSLPSGMRAGRAMLADTRERSAPVAVVRPRSTNQVVAVVRLAAAARLPIVPLGGGTGLMGGTTTVQPALVLDLRAMNRMLDVLPVDRSARVQSGVVIRNLNRALATYGLICGHDPWTVPIATVGGTISTNGLGYLAGRYGSMGDQVLGLEVVLADGRVLHIRSAERSATGPHLKRLFVGAEGTLGIITEATLRVFPLPERQSIRAGEFADFSAGYAAVCAMTAQGVRPAMIDYGAPPDGDGPARLNLAFEGFREEVEAVEQRALSICAAHGMTRLSDEEAAEFWANRHVEPERLSGWRRSEGSDPAPGTPGSSLTEYLHMYVPQSAVVPFLRAATERVIQAGARVSEWGLWNQPELVSMVMHAPTPSPQRLAEVRAAIDAVLMLAQDRGGSMEYVHGVGLRLQHLMAREHGEGLSTLRAIKTALDPHSLLNPGKLGM